ncbi:unnamed protein product [Callosobruchus maculatus]|uniref:Uncharacterized protein n=1 Tax=Callosobruchus maculatus TaxID=64391 RepID=A0A653CTE8_CALMS|nr:unnamed protein product [Callosobruchus maculatus]
MGFNGISTQLFEVTDIQRWVDGGGDSLVVTQAVVHEPPKDFMEHIHLAQSDPEDNVEDNLVPSNSSSIMNPFETDENVASVVEAPVTDTVLDLFGEDPLNDKNNGAVMLPELAKRFNHSLANGFDKEVISKLIAKHLPAANCSGLIPPILNPEIAEAFKNKDKVREDKFLISTQETVAASIMALYKETKLALDANKDVEFLADSTKLMLETFHKISLHRTYLLSPLLNLQKQHPSFKLQCSFQQAQDERKQTIKHHSGEQTQESQQLPAQSVEEVQETSIEITIPRSSAPYPGCSSFIREAFLKKGIPEEVIPILLASIAKGTLKNYDTVFSRWWDFCTNHSRDPYNYDLAEQDITNNENEGDERDEDDSDFGSGDDLSDESETD